MHGWSVCRRRGCRQVHLTCADDVQRLVIRGEANAVGILELRLRDHLIHPAARVPSDTPHSAIAVFVPPSAPAFLRADARLGADPADWSVRLAVVRMPFRQRGRSPPGRIGEPDAAVRDAAPGHLENSGVSLRTNRRSQSSYRRVPSGSRGGRSPRSKAAGPGNQRSCRYCCSMACGTRSHADCPTAPDTACCPVRR